MAVKCILTGQTPSVLDGVTENVQTQIDAKQDKISLTANRAVVVGADGKLTVSDVTSTELGYLDGVTSNIQTQLNSKLSSAPVTSVAGKTGAVTLAKGDVGLGNVDNTSDANKPISTATQTALDTKQDKITASGLLAGDGEGNITAAEETEVELVEITPDSIGAQSKITASGLLKGDGIGGITGAVAGTDYRTDVGLTANTSRLGYSISSSPDSLDLVGNASTSIVAGTREDAAKLILTPNSGSSTPNAAIVTTKYNNAGIVAAYDTSVDDTISGEVKLFDGAFSIKHQGDAVTEIIGVPTPTSKSGAANKKYVDEQIANVQTKVSVEGLLKGDGKGNIVAAIAGVDYAIPTTYTNLTMSASKWVDNTYSFEDTYPASAYDMLIQLASGATSDQSSAWSAANIAGSNTGNAVTATETVPSIDIPLLVQLTKI